MLEVTAISSELWKQRYYITHLQSPASSITILDFLLLARFLLSNLDRKFNTYKDIPLSTTSRSQPKSTTKRLLITS